MACKSSWQYQSLGLQVFCFFVSCFAHLPTLQTSPKIIVQSSIMFRTAPKSAQLRRTACMPPLNNGKIERARMGHELRYIMIHHAAKGFEKSCSVKCNQNCIRLHDLGREERNPEQLYKGGGHGGWQRTNINGYACMSKMTCFLFVCQKRPVSILTGHFAYLSICVGAFTQWWNKIARSDCSSTRHQHSNDLECMPWDHHRTRRSRISCMVSPHGKVPFHLFSSCSFYQVVLSIRLPHAYAAYVATPTKRNYHFLHHQHKKIYKLFMYI